MVLCENLQSRSIKYTWQKLVSSKWLKTNCQFVFLFLLTLQNNSFFFFPHDLMCEWFCASSLQRTVDTKHITYCPVEKLKVWYLVKSGVSKSVINFNAVLSLGAYLKIHFPCMISHLHICFPEMVAPFYMVVLYIFLSLDI